MLGPGWLFIETAGGVHSPGPSGTTQVDLYSSLRAPILLVGDFRLGGISQTIAAFESLQIRGLDVDAVLLFEDAQYENHLYLRDYFDAKGDVSITTLPKPPTRDQDSSVDEMAMVEYYEERSSDKSILKLLDELDRRGKDRIGRLEQMSQKAHETIWYPFTQQKLLTPQRISAIDSAHGDFFQVVVPEQTSAMASPASAVEHRQPLLAPAFDGSASWWTQGLGHGNSHLTLAAAYAAGRYGHVMFAEAVHEPALRLAETLLRDMGNSRLTRVFYSDNGSTGCEVAIKMAMRAAKKDTAGQQMTN